MNNDNNNRERNLQFDSCRRELKRVNKLYSVIFVITLIWTLSIVIYTLLDSVRAVMMNDSMIVHTLGGIVFPIAYFACTVMASVNKSRTLTHASPIFTGVGLAAGQFSNNEALTVLSFMMGPVSLIICGVMLYLHHRYDWLSQQEGFPHFQQLLDEQQQIYRGERENPVFIPKTYEEVKRRENGSDMDEILADTADLEPKKQEKNNYMDEL